MSTNYVIQPLETVTVWDDAEPIIPTVSKSVIVTNNGETKLEVVNYWAPPSHVFYPDTTYWVEPNDTIIVQAPERSFYYYRVNVTNSDDTKVGAAIVEILDQLLLDGQVSSYTG